MEVSGEMSLFVRRRLQPRWMLRGEVDIGFPRIFHLQLFGLSSLRAAYILSVEVLARWYGPSRRFPAVFLAGLSALSLYSALRLPGQRLDDPYSIR